MVTEWLTAVVSDSQLEAASWNSGSRAIKMVGHSGQASNSKAAKIVLGLEQVS